MNTLDRVDLHGQRQLSDTEWTTWMPGNVGPTRSKYMDENIDDDEDEDEDEDEVMEDSDKENKE